MTAARLLKQPSAVTRDERELLLAQVLGEARERLLAHPETEVSARAARRYRALVTRRAKGEPFAYLVGEKWFYGRAFKVTKATLIPRPATETLIEAVLDSRLRGNDMRIVDVGTGSGAIAVTLAAEMPKARVTVIDVSKAALRVARVNAKIHGVERRMTFMRSDILQKPHSPKTDGRQFSGTPIVIVANLPYIRTGDWKKLDTGITKYEPRLALTSGKDGLDHYRALMRRIAEIQLVPRMLLLEADPWQMTALKKLVRSNLPHHLVTLKKDLHGDNRILIAKARA